jgi:CheY-like chemotaxis protein
MTPLPWMVDDADTSTTIQGALEDRGFGTARIANGAEALDFLRRDTASCPMLILLDLVMPKMNGWACRRQEGIALRAPQMPVVLSSTNSHWRDPPQLKRMLILLDQMLDRPKPN